MAPCWYHPGAIDVARLVYLIYLLFIPPTWLPLWRQVCILDYVNLAPIKVPTCRHIWRYHSTNMATSMAPCLFYVNCKDFGFKTSTWMGTIQAPRLAMAPISYIYIRDPEIMQDTISGHRLSFTPFLLA